MFRKPLLALLAVTLVLPLLSRADDDDDESRSSRAESRDDDDREEPHQKRAPMPLSKPYVTECGSCHLAFPPSMLPARSWKALLAGLDDHFGQNAEVDAATRKALEAWLVSNAGRDVPGPTPLRITRLRWWLSDHDELAPATFQRKAVMSPANCAACHPGANQGEFGEHAVKVPRDAPAPR